jgi:formylglycine-generating enzyme required for sulfatase activity
MSATTPIAAVVPHEAPDRAEIRAGAFLMGSDDGRADEQPVHRVRVRPFRLGCTPVTHAQYEPFLATGRVEPPTGWSDPAFSHPQQPVVGVTWRDAALYAEWLSERTGRRWRLPTEAEWECAARGGLEGAPTAWGWRVPDHEIPEGPLDGPWPAGRGTPNGYGLLDMGTIVHEWCLDWYRADSYAVSPERDPRGPDTGIRRVSRGGSWRHRVRFSSPSARSSLPPAFRYSDYGFRVLQEMP